MVSKRHQRDQESAMVAGITWTDRPCELVDLEFYGARTHVETVAFSDLDIEGSRKRNARLESERPYSEDHAEATGRKIMQTRECERIIGQWVDKPEGRVIDIDNGNHRVGGLEMHDETPSHVQVRVVDNPNDTLVTTLRNNLNNTGGVGNSKKFRFIAAHAAYSAAKLSINRRSDGDALRQLAETANVGYKEFRMYISNEEILSDIGRVHRPELKNVSASHCRKLNVLRGNTNVLVAGALIVEDAKLTVGEAAEMANTVRVEMRGEEAKMAILGRIREQYSDRIATASGSIPRTRSRQPIYTLLMVHLTRLINFFDNRNPTGPTDAGITTPEQEAEMRAIKRKLTRYMNAITRRQ